MVSKRQVDGLDVTIVVTSSKRSTGQKLFRHKSTVFSCDYCKVEAFLSTFRPTEQFNYDKRQPPCSTLLPNTILEFITEEYHLLEKR